MKIEFQKIKNLLFSSTAKDSSILFSGVVTATITGFLLNIILTRNLTPYSYGLYITALTFTQLISDVSELGINSSVLAFVPSSKLKMRQIFIESSYSLKLIIGFCLGVVTLVLAKQISIGVFRDNSMTFFIKVSSMGIILLSLISWGQSVFQASRKFVNSMILGSSINVFRLVCIGFIVILGIKSAEQFFLISQLILVLSVFYLFFLLRVKLLNFFKIDFEVYKKILSFGVPIGISFAISAFYTKLDQLMLFNLAGAKESGVYGLAYRTAALSLFVSSSFHNAVIPRFASYESDIFQKYFIKVVLACIGLICFSTIAILLAPLLLPLVYGSSFNQSILPFQILMIGMSGSILASPFQSAILYRFKISKFSVVNATISLVMIVLVLNVLVPIYKSVGAAVSVSIVSFVQLFLAVSYFWYLWSKKSK